MKKKSLKNLQMLAMQIPAQRQEANFYVLGAEILKNNKHAKDRSGNPIEADKTYKAGGTMPLSNYRRLKKIFKKHGEEGVNKYVSDVMQSFEEATQQHANVLASMPSQPMSI
jgi:hypothetical protein